MSKCDRLNEYIKSLFNNVINSEINTKYSEISIKDCGGSGGWYADGTGGASSPSYEYTTTSLYTPTLKNNDDPSEDEIMEALQQDGMELRYVKTQTKKYCITAIAQSAFAIGFVYNQTEDLCIMAIELNYQALGFIRYPTKKIIDKAIDINPECYIYIDKERFPNEYKYAKLKCI